jgi:glutathione S-transferase
VYELVEVDLKNKPKDLLELNPYAKVPVLLDGDAVIYESAIINEYLDEKYPAISLMPKDPALRARARIWIDFCNNRIHAATHEIRHGGDPTKAKENLAANFLALDREMAGRDYIAGGYSIADVTFVPIFTRRERYGVPVEESLTPHLKRWMDRLLSRPAVRSTL